MTVKIWHIAVTLFFSVLAYFLYASLLSSSEGERHATEFTAGEIDGLLWSWKWIRSSGRISPTQLAPACPKCGMPIELEEKYPSRDTEPSERDKLAINPGRPVGSQVECEKCDYRKTWDRVPSEQKGFVAKEIMHLVNTDQWRQKMQHTFTEGVG